MPVFTASSYTSSKSLSKEFTKTGQADTNYQKMGGEKYTKIKVALLLNNPSDISATNNLEVRSPLHATLNVHPLSCKISAKPSQNCSVSLLVLFYTVFSTIIPPFQCERGRQLPVI